MTQKLLPLFLLVIPAAMATTVYQQAPFWTPGGQTGGTWAPHVDSANSGFRTYDNFTLGSAASINEVTWWGFHYTAAVTNGTPQTTQWTIGFYADSAGTVGSQIYSATFPAAQVSSQVVGTGVFQGNTFDIYRYSALLPTAFEAAGNTQYWFMPLSQGVNFINAFGWIQGVGGDSSSIQQTISAGNVTGVATRTTDRAFVLSNVPEPSTFVLLGLGSLGLALAGRRKLG